MTSAKQTTNIPIARWNIKVNSVSIKNGESLSSVISPVFPGSEHVASGIIAPTAEGYFDLALDFTDADVSFSYSLNIEPNADSSVSDIIVTGYSIDDAEPVYFEEGDDKTLSDNVYYNSGVTNRTFRVYIKWDEFSDTATMDNSADTAATFDTAAGALLDVNITFTQIANQASTT